MGKHIFDLALPLGNLPDLDTGFRRHSLIGASFEKLAHPKPTGVASSPARWQNVVRSNTFIPVGYSRLLTDKEGAVIGEALCVVPRILHVKLEVLGSILITQADGFVSVFGDGDDPVAGPGQLSHIPCRQNG